MTSLHIINHLADVKTCQALIADTDAVLLCGDAVYALRQPLGLTHRLYALAEDVQARGFEPFNQAKSVDYPEFVALCASYAKVVAW